LLLLSAFLALKKFCETTTKGFSLQEILPTAALEKKQEGFSFEIDALLAQPFTLFDVGDQSFVFIGADQKTVLKCFKHTHKWRARALLPVFHSCTLAEHALKEETALLYLHLQETENLPCRLALTDALGITHILNANKLEFVLQKKALPFFQTLDLKMQYEEIEEATLLLTSLLEHIARRCRKGIGDGDTALKRNFGVIDNRAVQIDVGSFFENDALKEAPQQMQELLVKTARLKRWLKDHYPQLLPVYAQKLADMNLSQ
jgi:hypothetical protein